MNCSDCEFSVKEGLYDSYCEFLGIEVDEDEEACTHAEIKENQR